MVEVKGVRLRPFSLTCLIYQGCQLLLMLYIFALEPFLSKVKGKPAPILPHVIWLHWGSLCWQCQHASYKQCQGDWGEQRNRKAQSCDRGPRLTVKSLLVQLSLWKSCALPGPFSWEDGSCKILGVWFSPNLQLEKNWLKVLEKVVATTDLWLHRWLSLNGWAEVCISHIYYLAVYQLSVLSIPCTILFKLERILFQFIWAK